MKRTIKIELEIDIEMDENTDEYQSLCNISVKDQDNSLNVGFLNEVSTTKVNDARIVLKEFKDLSITPYLEYIDSLGLKGGFVKSDVIIFAESFIKKFNLKAYVGKNIDLEFIVGVESDLIELNKVLLHRYAISIDELFKENIYLLFNNSGIRFSEDAILLADKGNEIILSASFSQLDEDPNKYISLFNSFIPIHPAKLYSLMKQK